MAGKPGIESDLGSEDQEEPADIENLGELARIVAARIAERGITRKELEKRSGISVATIRVIEHPKGPRKFSHKVLEALSEALEWPPGHLVRVAYPSYSEAPGPIVQAMMTALAPYLEKLDSIPGLQADVAAIKDGLGITVDIIHEVDDSVPVDRGSRQGSDESRDGRGNDGDRPSEATASPGNG